MRRQQTLDDLFEIRFVLFALVPFIVVLPEMDEKFGDLGSFGRSDCVHLCQLDLAVDRIVGGALVQSDQMLVGQDENSVLQEAVSVEFFDVGRVVQSFLLTDRLTNVQRLLDDAQRVLLW